jgi:hypothetical protein
MLENPSPIGPIVALPRRHCKPGNSLMGGRLVQGGPPAFVAAQIRRGSLRTLWLAEPKRQRREGWLG